MRPFIFCVVAGLGGCFSKPELSPAAQDGVRSDGDGTAANAAPDALACASFGLWSVTVTMRHPEISRDGTTLVFSRYAVNEPDMFFSRRSCQ